MQLPEVLHLADLSMSWRGRRRHFASLTIPFLLFCIHVSPDEDRTVDITSDEYL